MVSFKKRSRNLKMLETIQSNANKRKTAELYSDADTAFLDAKNNMSADNLMLLEQKTKTGKMKKLGSKIKSLTSTRAIKNRLHRIKLSIKVKARMVYYTICSFLQFQRASTVLVAKDQ